MQIRRTAAALMSATALSVTGVAMATPAQAAPVITGGLVNVTIVDALDVTIKDVNVALGVALQLAANVCDVNVLAVDLADGATTCTNEVTGQTGTIDRFGRTRWSRGRCLGTARASLSPLLQVRPPSPWSVICARCFRSPRPAHDPLAEPSSRPSAEEAVGLAQRARAERDRYRRPGLTPSVTPRGAPEPQRSWRGGRGCVIPVEFADVLALGRHHQSNLDPGRAIRKSGRVRGSVYLPPDAPAR